MKLKTLSEHMSQAKPIVGPIPDFDELDAIANRQDDMRSIARLNQSLVRFIRSHDSYAFENEFGTVTMENRFFNAPSEWVNVSTFDEARIQLNY